MVITIEKSYSKPSELIGLLEKAALEVEQHQGIDIHGDNLWGL